ncbi:hypothetical protein G9A89_002704 [Geosiphon pyriformis]|nr:hypothetical protein G9A89_002704 [Geosiphon pyriformis]
MSNKCADAFTKTAVFSDLHLLHMIDEYFLKAGGITVFSNSRHFVLVDSLYADVDWSRFFLTAGFQMYFMKTLHHCLLVAVYKCLYNRSYPSVICLFCGDVEVSDHVFSCPFDAAGHA